MCVAVCSSTYKSSSVLVHWRSSAHSFTESLLNKLRRREVGKALTQVYCFVVCSQLREFNPVGTKHVREYSSRHGIIFKCRLSTQLYGYFDPFEAGFSERIWTVNISAVADSFFNNQSLVSNSISPNWGSSKRYLQQVRSELFIIAAENSQIFSFEVFCVQDLNGTS